MQIYIKGRDKSHAVLIILETLQSHVLGGISRLSPWLLILSIRQYESASDCLQILFSVLHKTFFLSLSYYICVEIFGQHVILAIYLKESGHVVLVQWLRLHTSNAGGPSSTPGQGTKILHATQ